MGHYLADMDNAEANHSFIEIDADTKWLQPIGQGGPGDFGPRLVSMALERLDSLYRGGQSKGEGR